MPIGRPRKEVRVKPNDLLVCPVCKKSYTRSNSYHHKRTNYHNQQESIINFSKIIYETLI